MRKTSLQTDGENLHRDLLKERERGREEKSNSRDLSNMSLKTDGGGVGSESLHRILSKERRREEEKSKSRDLSNRSLKTDGETESGEPTYGSLEKETGKRARAMNNTAKAKTHET